MKLLGASRLSVGRGVESVELVRLPFFVPFVRLNLYESVRVGLIALLSMCHHPHRARRGRQPAANGGSVRSTRFHESQ